MTKADQALYKGQGGRKESGLVSEDKTASSSIDQWTDKEAIGALFTITYLFGVSSEEDLVGSPINENKDYRVSVRNFVQGIKAGSTGSPLEVLVIAADRKDNDETSSSAVDIESELTRIFKEFIFKVPFNSFLKPCGRAGSLRLKISEATVYIRLSF